MRSARARSISASRSARASSYTSSCSAMATSRSGGTPRSSSC